MVATIETRALEKTSKDRRGCLTGQLGLQTDNIDLCSLLNKFRQHPQTSFLEPAPKGQYSCGKGCACLLSSGTTSDHQKRAFFHLPGVLIECGVVLVRAPTDAQGHSNSGEVYTSCAVEAGRFLCRIYM